MSTSNIPKPALRKSSKQDFLRTKLKPVVAVMRTVLTHAKSVARGRGMAEAPESEGVIKEVTSNDYDFIKKLGSGGFSHVYAARRRKRRGTMEKIKWLRRNGRSPSVEYEPTVYAVKVCETNQDNVCEELREEVPSWESWEVREYMVKATSIEEIVQEVEILRSLQGCEHIVVLHQAFRVKREDQVYLAMERLIVTVSKISKDDGFVRHSTAIPIVLRQLLEGVSFLKSQKIIHRDIKCSNIMLSTVGLIKICDFGLSERVESEEKPVASKHEAGSEQYMAPELFIPNCEYDYGVDLWAFGIVAWRIFRGSKRTYSEFKDQYWKRWRQGNGHYFGELLGPIFITKSEHVALLKQKWLEIEHSSRESGQSDGDIERRFKNFNKWHDPNKREYQEGREENADLIKIVRSCLVPIPASGPDWDITRNDFLQRASAETLFAMDFFKPRSELSSRQAIVALVREYKESDDELAEELEEASLC